MADLNDAQLRAVTHFEGPMLVLAGPGSGKTRVITERICHLIDERGVDPTHILVITFTKAAAVEMQQRYQKMGTGRKSGVRFGTFHAIFFMILKYSYHYNAQNIIQDNLRRELLKGFLHETDLEIEDENEFLGDLESEISRVKGERMALSNYFSPLCSNEVFQEIFGRYEKELKRRRLIDFDDMLVHCCELLEREPETLKLWQDQFRYILIDEFQDISRIQYDVVRLLAAPRNNIFIVGDDDQSIYGFRGAKPDIMKQFLEEFHAGRELLGINYRCAAPIVEAAGRLISHNRNRLPKEIRPAAETVRCEDEGAAAGERRQPMGVCSATGADGQSMEIRPATGAGNQADHACITVEAFPRPQEQNSAICRKLSDYHHRQGIPYKEMAVLFRTNTQARALSAKLMENNIPFTIKEHLPSLYDHWIAQDVMTYIRIAMGSRERGQVLRIINRPKRYVHRNAFTEPYVDFEELERFYEDKGWMVERLEQLKYDLSVLAKMKPYAAVNFIRRGIGYEDYIKEYADYRGIRADAMYEILDELQEEARDKESFEQWFDEIRTYKEELSRQSQGGRNVRQGAELQDSVMLMTMHGAKGLEFECVFIPDANEGVTPHSKSVLNADMEEERRMFYVAMTRAKHHLHISYTAERFNKDVEPSRFVEELAGKP